MEGTGGHSAANWSNYWTPCLAGNRCRFERNESKNVYLSKSYIIIYDTMRTFFTQQRLRYMYAIADVP